MSTYENWKEKPTAVTSLLLDAQNPRIPSLSTTMLQRDIIGELVKHDDVYELARNISKLGYFPTERLIVVEENAEEVVVEGNRRLAALKLLINPSLAPDEYQKRFTLLQSGISISDFKDVKVVIAPSRDAAAPLIIDRHTHTGVDRWQPAQQAKYLRTLLRPGVTIDDVSKRYGIARADLVDALKTDTMYKVACRLELDDDVKKVVTNPRAFSASTLDRLIRSKQSQDFMGISFDKDGKLAGTVHPDEFKKTLKRVVSDIARNKIDSRELKRQERNQKVS
jgi:hypothetical protein